MRGTLLFLGTKPGIIARAKLMGYRVHLIDYVQNSNEADKFIFLDKHASKTLNYSLKNFESLITDDLRGIIVCFESFVMLGAQLRERYRPELNGLNCKQAQVVRDKWLLKSKLVEFGIPTTKVLRIDFNTQYNYLVKQLGSPFILKPKNEFLAIGINLIQTQDEMSRWLKLNEAKIDQYFAEEYIENATEYCCDTIVENGVIIAQFPGEYTVTCLDSNKKQEGIGVNFPGFLPEEKINLIKEYTKIFIDRLEIKNGFCHTEFLYDGKSWKFGEMGVRLPGGYQLPTETFIAGVNLLDRYIKIFANDCADISVPIIPLNQYCGYYLFPKKVGFITSIKSHLESLSWVIDSKIYVKEGETITKEDTSVSMAAHAIYLANTLSELKIRSEQILTAVNIQVRQT